MSEVSKDLVATAEGDSFGPDYFGFYICQVASLLSSLSDHDGFLPVSTHTGNLARNLPDHVVRDEKIVAASGGSPLATLFSQGVACHLSEFDKERLRLLLCESVATFTQELDELLDPIISMCQIQSCLRKKKGLVSLSGAEWDSDEVDRPQKKLKLSCSPQADGDDDDDLQFLLENDSSLVEEMMKKYTDQYLARIGRMGEKVEELLDTVMSSSRPMTHAEKQQLYKLIRNLPPRNLDRVVEIIQRSRTPEKRFCDEIDVDLEKEEKITLWRLYFYVETVEKARRLCP